jgi:ubiquinone/menaquinone biosynthesis C-methylase UbiE
MTDHKAIYQQDAERYDRLVMCEDQDENLLPAIEKIIPLDGLDVVELGAGTGRLTTLIAPKVHSLKAFDLSPHMLAITERKLEAMDLPKWKVKAADHRRIPLKKKCADLVISGWSICYLNEKTRKNWKKPFLQALKEMKRLLRSGGKIIIIETEGTGVTQPKPPQSMLNYLNLLREQGFRSEWIRTDYLFNSWEEAMELVPFFFGEEMLDDCINASDGVILPECTGIWHWAAD